MSDIIIKVEGLGKKYIIAHENPEKYTALRDVLTYKARKLINRSIDVVKAKEEFWALKNINFEIKKGDVIGVIGRNGAGKSTLLKILSRITEPTTGRIELNGRIASLLEVGTGFHPELTGRENIFLNGAILGMSRVEIRSKFDEIVDFSGIEKFLDTPVKRYSSGMYVRLAFAVAAHLEPEILVVDEVLAVGDAEFQKKCLGKMESVSKNDGRTILFVSHNMTALKNICKNAIWLESGTIKDSGGMNKIAMDYLNDIKDGEGQKEDRNIDNLKKAVFLNWSTIKYQNEAIYISKMDGGIKFDFQVNRELNNLEFGLIIRDYNGVIIFSVNSRDNKGTYLNLKKGKYSILFEYNLPIKSGKYELDIIAVCSDEIIDQWLPKKRLTVVDELNTVLPDNWKGIISEYAKFSYNEGIS